MLRTPIGPGGTSPAVAHTAMLEALLAGEGFRRVAEIAEEHVRAPVGIYVPRPGTEGATGSAPERFVAALVAGGDPPRPPEVVEMAPIVSGGILQGAVLMLAEGAPGASAYLGTAAFAALTGIAMLNARDESLPPPSGSLLEWLLTGEVAPGEVLRQARLAGCDLGDGAVGVCLEPRGVALAALASAVRAEFPDALVGQLGDRVYALLPGSAEVAGYAARRLAARAPAGVSSHYLEAGEARLALHEAELLLDAGAAADGGTLRLIFRLAASHPDEVARFVEETIGPLLRHDEENGTELVRTLRAYGESNCNMNLTAQATYTHRHTVSNRLVKIRELAGLDPSQSEDRESLGLALKARRASEALARR